MIINYNLDVAMSARDNVNTVEHSHTLETGVYIEFIIIILLFYQNSPFDSLPFCGKSP